MRQKAGKPQESPRRGGFRKCLQAGLGSRSGRVVGGASVLVPVMSYIIYDLQQPDSTVRRLASAMTNRLLAWQYRKRRLTDITDKVEVVAEREEDVR